MPIHDWNKVPAGIFHAMYHRWISAISDFLNTGTLPTGYYALPEQQAGGLGPDVLTLQARGGGADVIGASDRVPSGTAILLRSPPQARFVAEAEVEAYRRKKNSIVVRHVSGDRVVAVLEILSPGNKAGVYALRQFVENACNLLEQRIHLLIVDPFPPGPRDPNGLHAAIWEEFQGQTFALPKDKPLTVAAYECDLATRAYIEPVAVGDLLPVMPLFLAPGAHVPLPLEDTYQTAFSTLP